METNTSFTEGKILKPLILFAFPVLLALFLQAMYGAVDLLIVGKFASSADVSAVSQWEPQFCWDSRSEAEKKRKADEP